MIPTVDDIFTVCGFKPGCRNGIGREGRSSHLTLTDEDDGKLFRVRVLNTGEERIARYHCFSLAGRPLKFPCFADPDHRITRTIIDAVRVGSSLAMDNAAKALQFPNVAA